MSDLVRNPEDRFSHNEAHIKYHLSNISFPVSILSVCNDTFCLSFVNILEGQLKMLCVLYSKQKFRLGCLIQGVSYYCYSVQNSLANQWKLPNLPLIIIAHSTGNFSVLYKNISGQ